MCRDVCCPGRDYRPRVGFAAKMLLGDGASAVCSTGKDTARKRLVGREGRMGSIMVVATNWSGPIGLAGVTVVCGWCGGDRNIRGINLRSRR